MISTSSNDALDAAERELMSQLMVEVSQRKLQWPCWECRLKLLSEDATLDACGHAAQPVIYEQALAELLDQRQFKVG